VNAVGYQREISYMKTFRFVGADRGRAPPPPPRVAISVVQERPFNAQGFFAGGPVLAVDVPALGSSIFVWGRLDLGLGRA
jgi:hypothetical protein